MPIGPVRLLIHRGVGGPETTFVSCASGTASASCLDKDASIISDYCEGEGTRCEVRGARCEVQGARCEVVVDIRDINVW